MSDNRVRLIVLNDGETFTGMSGCKIIDAPAEASTGEIEDALAEIGPSGEMPNGFRLLTSDLGRAIPRGEEP